MKQGIDGCEKDSSMEETRVTTDRVMRRAGDSSYEWKSMPVGCTKDGEAAHWRNRQIPETDEENNNEENIFSVRFYYVKKELLHV